MKQINWYYFNDYEGKGYRPLTFAERKINLTMIQSKLNTLSKIIDDKVKPLIPRIIKGESWVKTTIVNILSDLQKEAFELWKKTASTEMKVQVPPSKKEIYGVLKQSNDQIITKIMDDIQNRLKQDFSEEWMVIQFINWFKTLFLVGWLNLWRQVVFEQYPNDVYAFQYSAILDWATTPLCRKLDGIIVKPNSPEVKKYQPPLHWNCRSIWVEILKEETYKPAFTPVVKPTPKEIKINKDYKKWTKKNAIENLLAILTKMIT